MLLENGARGRSSHDRNSGTAATHLLPAVAFLYEVLDLHLLEFPGAEDEVPRGNFVPERFSHLGDPKGNLNPTKHASSYGEYAGRKKRQIPRRN